MKKPLVLGLAVLCLTALSLLAPREAVAANCECYYSTDCGSNQYCNWNDPCTRHCELQGAWLPAWGSPPVSRADCDSYIGACHDNLPQPPNGDDGDKQNCEPPTATTPTGGTLKFKMRDGMCATRPVVGEADPLPDVETTTDDLVALAEQGGGLALLQADPYVRTMMFNLATLALGQYDFRLRGPEPAVMADVRGTCAAEALRVLGAGLEAEIGLARRHRATPHGGEAGTRHSGEEHDVVQVSGPAYDLLQTLSPQCQEWIQTRPHNCQFPHPEEHEHVFDYEDGLHCIAHQLQSMARSLNPRR